jgi:hypothetical protein
MKKIVSIFIALFVFIGMNAQTVTFNYNEFTSQIATGSGVSSITVSKNGISITVGDTYKNSRTATRGFYESDEFLCARGSSKAVFTMSVSLTDVSTVFDDSKKIIKDVKVYTSNSDLLLGGTVDEDVTVTKGTDYFFTFDNDYNEIDGFTYTMSLTKEARISRIEVTYGELMEEVTLSDEVNYPYTGYNIYAKKATYTRSMGTNHWGTLCLPFAYTLSDDNFGGYYTHSMSNIADGFATVKKYANGEKIGSGMPIIFYTNNSELVVTANKVTLSTNSYVDGISTVTRQGDQGQKFIICGNLNKVRYENEYLYYVAKDKLIYCAGNANVNVKPYRAFIRPDNSRSSRRYANVRSLAFNVLDEDDNVIDNFSFADNDDVTVVESAEADTEENIIGIFTADGKKVNELHKGLNIVKTTNGVKKVYIR